MKYFTTLLLLLSFRLSPAATGNAYDGALGAALIVVIVLLFPAIGYLLDYLIHRHQKAMSHSTKEGSTSDINSVI